MSKLGQYLENMSDYYVAKYNGIDIDLGGHAKERSNDRLSASKDDLLKIANKIANVFDKNKPDGLFGFYSLEEHISGIFRYFKYKNAMKFITVFPNKKVQFFNDIKGMVVFNEEYDGLIEVIEV